MKNGTETRAQLIRTIARGIAKAFKPQLEGLKTDIKALEQKLDSIGKEFRYCGVWQRAQQYQRGNFVTHNGTVWHCNNPSQGYAPGTSGDWTLAVKGGDK